MGKSKILKAQSVKEPEPTSTTTNYLLFTVYGVFMLVLGVFIAKYDLVSHGTNFYNKIVNKKLSINDRKSVLTEAYNDVYNAVKGYESFNIKKFSIASNLTVKGFDADVEDVYDVNNNKVSIKLFQQAVKKCDYALDARHRLALTAFNNGDEKKAIELWKYNQELLQKLHNDEGYQQSWDHLMTESIYKHGTPSNDILPYKLRHDAEHLQYLSELLLAKGELLLSNEYSELSANYWKIAAQLSEVRHKFKRHGNEYGFIPMTPDALKNNLGNKLGVTWKLPEVLELPPLTGNALRQISESEMNEFLEAFERDRVIVVDNLLTDEALELAFEAAVRAPVWHEVKPWGYLGAYPTTGLTLVHPVYLAIAKELPVVYKRIFDQIEFNRKKKKLTGHNNPKYEITDEVREMGLSTLWCYKYENNGTDTDRKGIGIHADDAAVNTNIWLTPDSANFDPDSGGIIVYKEVANKGWSQLKDTRDVDVEDKLRKFWEGRDNVTVPYLQNRMVLFDSERYHRTDNYHFRKGFKNKRINLTVLYGYRPSTSEKKQ